MDKYKFEIIIERNEVNVRRKTVGVGGTGDVLGLLLLVGC